MTLRLLPSSLAGRTVLLVIAVIAVAEFATFSLLGHFRRTSHVNQTVQLIAGQVPVDGRIVFMRRAAFPKGLPRFTVGIDSLISEFPIGDRDAAERAAAAYRPAWEVLKAEAKPSPLVNPKSVVDG